MMMIVFAPQKCRAVFNRRFIWSSIEIERLLDIEERKNTSYIEPNRASSHMPARTDGVCHFV